MALAVSRVINYLSVFLLSFTLSACVTNNFNYPEAKCELIKKDKVMNLAKGEFSVKMSPVDGSNTLKIEKTYNGELQAESFGEMLATRSKVEGSASYVAIETVSGSLAGKSGAFTLVHRGVMQGDNKELLVTISPDSGTGDLDGISGSMEIVITEGKHFYILDYQLPE